MAAANNDCDGVGDDEQDQRETFDAARLRPALEFALGVVREARASRTGLRYPSELDRFANKDRVPRASLETVRRIIDADDSFRGALAATATGEVVDEVGLLWLQRPAGWRDRFRSAVAEAVAAEADADLARQLKRAERRRAAAERAAARVVAKAAAHEQHVGDLQRRLDDAKEQIERLTDTVEQLRADRAEARVAARHARDRLQATEERLEQATAQLNETAVAEGGNAAPERGSAGQDEKRRASGQRRGPGQDRPVAGHGTGQIDNHGDQIARAEVARITRQLAPLLEALRNLVDTGSDAGADRPERQERQSRRRRLSMPGGVVGETAEGAAFLLGSGARIFVDGYNVTKLQWPNLQLIDQRQRLAAAVESFVARTGAEITIVFDGSDVVGAHARVRRNVRIVFSSPGQTADDKIRDEVRAVPANRAVVVVTDDREIRDDVADLGGNLVSSRRFVAALRVG